MRCFVTSCSLLTGLCLLTATSFAEDLPFQLSGVGDGRFILAGNPPMPIGFAFTAEGVATHLGDWTNSGTVLIDGPDPDIEGNLLVMGVVTFVAANGDELDGLIAGSLNPVTGVGNAEFCWDGGTGRFADAAGDVGFAVAQSPPNELGQFEFVIDGDGRIDY